MNNLIIQLDNLSLTFSQNAKPIFLLKEQISIRKNEITLISGKSGSGKSSLLKILAGIIPTHLPGVVTGGISFFKDGTKIKREELKISLVSQNPYSQIIYKKVSDDFCFNMENDEFSPLEMQNCVAHFFTTYKLNHLLNRTMATLSAGECQKIMLLSAISSGAQVLLLDEPTAFMDPKSRNDFYCFLASLKANHTIIMIDHNLEEVEKIVDNKIFITRDTTSSNLATDEIIFNKDRLKGSTQPTLTNNIMISNLSLCAGEDKKNIIAANINLVAKSRDVVAILGANGCGKSTLIKAIAGIRQYFTGNISINNQIINKGIHACSVIFQNPEIHFFFDTIEEELQHDLSNIISDAQKIKTLTSNILSVMNLENQKNISPILLSEGEKRRLSFILGTIKNLPIVLFDEPTFGQDQENIEQIISMILTIKSQEKIQIVITHDYNFAKRIANKIFFLTKDGLMKVVDI